MKKIVLTLVFLTISALLLAQTKANVKMLNGDEIPCDIMTEAINIITDYGELGFRTEFIKEIQFPEPGKGTTLLKTVFGELFRGFITNDTIELSVYGKQMVIRKAKINKIEFDNPLQKAKDYTVTVSLRNGDGFFGNMVGEMMTIQTSYGEVELPFDNMVQIAFEGFGNVLSKIEMKDGGVVQGIIKNEYLPLTLLSELELEVVPDLMKQVGFYQEELTLDETVQDADSETEVFSIASVFSSPEKTEEKEIIKTSLDAEMVLVKAGTFQMGNTRGDSDGEDDEKPIHKVELTYGFYIGKCEITFAEYDEFCQQTGKSKPNDEGWGRGKHPVINVSWWDAIQFCNWLSDKEGLHIAYGDDGSLLDENGLETTDITKVQGYRLLTEAEWEYAARGGHKSIGDYKYSGSNRLQDVGWYDGNSGGKTHEVGLNKPNKLNLFDMSGNVYEWCYDWSKSEFYKNEDNANPICFDTSAYYRVKRGGGWSSEAIYCRIANRANDEGKYNNLGFRIAKRGE